MALRGGVPLVAGVAVLAVLAWWFGIGGVIAALRAASPAGLCAYLALSVAVLALQAGRWRLMAVAVGAPADFGRVVAARLAGDGVASLLPLARIAGDPLRAVLARRGEVRLSSASAGVAIDRLLELIGNMLAVTAYVAVFSAAAVGATSPRTSLAIGGAMFVLLALLASLILRFARGDRPLAPLYGSRARAWAGQHARWLDGLRQVEDHLVEFFRAHRVTFLAGLGLTVLIELVVVLQYRALLGAFGVRLDLPILLMVLLGGGVARAVPTPGALGSLEAVQVLAVGATTGNADLGFVVGIIMRLHETLLVVAGLIALSMLGFSPTRLPTAGRQVPAP
ncbi:MAG TPA: lysylphosphatidylglycerol synthase transmembrane domain-containing protein [Candidatus Dormibacteraeota bacterium]|nr:lysylphosphatidylglycerol synthase transmembrane domain-containing protein [Candidatus Dormibacteraeota bacterium]